MRTVDVDARGLNCPLPLLKAKKALNELDSGDRLHVSATDAGSRRDFRSWAELSGHRLVASDEQDGVYSFVVEKK